MPTDDDQRDAARRDSTASYHKLRTLSAQRHLHRGPAACRSTVGWSKRGFIDGAARVQRSRRVRCDHVTLNALDDRAHDGQPASAASTRSTTTCCTTAMLQQRISAFYNAQCCGLAFEYQTYNYGAELDVADSRRPPVLPVVHARRPRQLLAVQRRAERRPAVTARTDVEPDPRHRRRRIRRQPSARSARRATAPTSSPGTGPAARRRATAPARAGRRSICSTATAVGAAIARLRPVGRLPLRRRRARRARRGTSTESTFAINVRGTHHLLEALRARRRAGARADPELGAGLRDARTTRSPRTHPLVPASPYGAQQAGAGDARRASGTARLTVTIARAFNHFGPRQDPHFAASGFARRIADIEAGRWAPEIAVGNLDARRDLTDVRDTVRAYRLILERGQPGRPYNVCSGRAIAIRDLLDMLLARARVPIAVTVDPARYRPNDTPLLLGDPAPHPRRARMDAGDSARADARRSARLLAQPARHESAGDGRHRISRPRRRGRARGTRTRARGLRAQRQPQRPARHADRRRRPRSRRTRARRRRLRRHLALGGARQHLAETARGLRRHQRRRPAQRAGGRRGARHAAGALHLVVRRAAAARPHRAARGQRLPAHEGRRRPPRRRGGARRQPADSRLPGRRLRTGIVHGGQSDRPADRGSPAGASCPASSDPSTRGRTPTSTTSRRDTAPRWSADASAGDTRSAARTRRSSASSRSCSS